MRKSVLRNLVILAFVGAVAGLPAINSMAAPEDTIDPTMRANFTIHKYDITAAKEAGIHVTSSGFANNGKEDMEAEDMLKNYAIQGVEFTYVKIGNINMETEGGRVQILYDIPTALEDVLGLVDSRGDHKYTSEQLNQALADTLSDSVAGKNKLEHYIVNADEKTVMPITDENGETGAGDIALGLYLVIETKVPANVHTTTDPFFVSAPMTDNKGDAWCYEIDVYPKNQTGNPELDKLVKQRDDKTHPYEDVVTGSEGDTLDYILVSRLPEITSQATYLSRYLFVDRMDKGLTYHQDVIIYFYDNEEDARANNREKAVKTWEIGAKQMEVSYDDENEQYNQMTVALSEEGLKEVALGMSQHWMVVTYSCVMNSDISLVLGDEGNVNDVELTWKRTASDSVGVLKDRAKVYTFGINLQKKFSDTDGNTKNVHFVLKNQTDGYYVTAEQRGDFGVYYVTDGTKGESEAEGTVFVPDADGTLLINGLEADRYVLKEIATDAGYSLLKEPMLIEIQSTVDEIIPSKTTRYDSSREDTELIESKLERASAFIDGETTNMSLFESVNGKTSTNSRVDITVLNSKTLKLPQTGGYGPFIFTLTGCGVFLTGVVVATRKTRRHRKED